MPGARRPREHDLRELLGRQARVRRGHERADRLLATRERALDVAGEQRPEGLLVLPFRVLRCQGLHAVDGEQEREIERLLRPQRAVVVEHGDALGRGDELRAALLRHARDEVDDGLAPGTVFPGRQRVPATGGRDTGGTDTAEREQQGSETNARASAERPSRDAKHGYRFRGFGRAPRPAAGESSRDSGQPRRAVPSLRGAARDALPYPRRWPGSPACPARLDRSALHGGTREALFRGRCSCQPLHHLAFRP